MITVWEIFSAEFGSEKKLIIGQLRNLADYVLWATRYI